MQGSHEENGLVLGLEGCRGTTFEQRDAWLLGGAIAEGLLGVMRENGVSVVTSVRDDVQYYRRKMGETVL